MGQTQEGDLDARDVRVALVVSRFNEYVTGRLLDGAVRELERLGCSAEARTVIRVPGAWEIPFGASKLAASEEHDVIIALGALIRGETPHFDVLAAEVARGLGQLALESGTPVVFGVLTTDTLEQAIARSGGKAGHKGVEAVHAAVEMARLRRRLEGRGQPVAGS